MTWRAARSGASLSQCTNPGSSAGLSSPRSRSRGGGGAARRRPARNRANRPKRSPPSPRRRDSPPRTRRPPPKTTKPRATLMPRTALSPPRPPASGDRCAAAGTAQGTTTLGNGAQARRTLPCQEQAQDLLAARLAGKAKVSCRFPGGSRQDSPAICLDGDGVDLGGFLVAEGLALADPAQSYDYVGAEGIARAQKRGLWLFR